MNRPTSRQPEPAEATANGAAFRPTPGPPLSELDFDDDYRSYPMTEAEQEDSERRLEFWDGETETALEVRDEGVTLYHERPSHRLAQLVERIAQVRGEPIACYGTTDLEFPAGAEHRKRILEADQCLYLHPARANLAGPTVKVGEDPYPDVIMEVDYSTDVRRHKLKLYEAWGFPEVWVDVPEESQRRKPHGLTIYLRDGSVFAPAPVSRAFPSWRATEIHAAMHEERLSEHTVQILERIGRLLGERDGSGPDDDPMIRSLRQQAQADAQAEARAAELERRAVFVRRQLTSRGIQVAANFPLDQPSFAEADVEAVAEIALRCTSQADFAAQLKQAPKGPETQ